MKWIAAVVIVLCVLLAAAGLYSNSTNAGVIEELRTQPDGERARKVMLLTLPSGNAIPVNYIRDGSTVYAAADFPWWRKIKGSDGRASVLIRGKTLHGNIRAERDDPALRDSVFDRLRPTAPRFTGTLIIIELDEAPLPFPTPTPTPTRKSTPKPSP